MQQTPHAMCVSSHRFSSHDLIGGQLALDAVNTVTAWDTSPVDWLADYASLLEWAALAKAVDAAEVRALRRAAAERPRQAVNALRAFRGLRQCIQLCFTALAMHRPIASASLRALNEYRAAAVLHAKLVVIGGNVMLRCDVRACGLDLPTHRVTLSAVDLLLRPPGSRLRVCAGHDCGWLFKDTSKSGRRRWCDMDTCGAADKMSRYRRSLATQSRDTGGAQ
jgi:predicted RNA-binding Zn ribbon-like protein